MKRMLSIFGCLLVLAIVQPAMAKNPYLKPDNSWITLNGTVVTAGTDSFELDYGEGIVTVEMDDWDWYGDAHGILSGDQVTVYGMVDDDLYETTSIEASSVYVKDLNTFFYASAADEEDVVLPVFSTVYVDADLQLSGKVTQTSGREFTIDTGKRKITVNTSQMLYNPMDNRGYQKIRKGDRVQVTGDLDIDLFEEKEIMAETIITLEKDKKRSETMEKSMES